MLHLNRAVLETLPQLDQKLQSDPPYISADNHVVQFQIQSDPIGKVGVNGASYRYAYFCQRAI